MARKQNKKLTRSINTKEFYDLLAFHCGITPKTAERIIRALKYIMLQELKTHEKIRIDGLGTFYSKDINGCDRIMPNGYGELEKRYLEKRKAVSFKPAKVFTTCLNGQPMDKRAKKDAETNMKYQHELETDQLDEYIPDINDFAEDYLRKKQEKAKARKDKFDG